MTKKCICQICTCGRHKCPHFPRGGQISVEPCTISEYANRYQAHKVEPVKLYKPDQKPVRSEAALEDLTTNKVDYVAHQLEKPYHHNPERYAKPDGEFDMTTNYSIEYNKKPMEMVKMVRPVETKKIHARFDGIPTYSTDYRKWDTQPREHHGPSGTYQPTEAPFDGSTNYSHEFVNRGPAMRESLKPQERPLNSGNFEDATDYRQSYIKHNLPEKFVKDKVTWEPMNIPFDDQSNYKTEYTCKQGGQLPSFKPDNKPYTSAAPFEGITTQNVDYQAWPMEQIKRREHDSYKKPDGDMSMDTTTATDFTRKQGEVVKAVKPAESRKVHGQFDGTTNYQMEYKPWAVDRVKPHAQEGYMPNEAPFEGLPMYQTDYVRHNAQLTKSMKPDDRSYKSSAPIDDHTEYRDEFFKKKIDVCPALPLQSDSKYPFVQDDSGHKWYNVNNNIKA